MGRVPRDSQFVVTIASSRSAQQDRVCRTAPAVNCHVTPIYLNNFDEPRERVQFRPGRHTVGYTGRDLTKVNRSFTLKNGASK